MSRNRNRNYDGGETVYYRGYSIITFFKIIVVAMIMTFVMNTFSYANVSFNHVLSKAIGLSQDVWAVCENCFNSIVR